MPRSSQPPGGRSAANRDAWVEVDLDAIVGNAGILQGLVSAGTRLAPVVKADAYGHGGVPVALALERAGYELFCVATVDEGLALRAAGLRARIMTLYQPPVAAWPVAAGAGMEIAVTSREGLEQAIALDPHGAARVQLKVDTGMTRQGLLPDDVALAARHGRDLAPVTAGLWTHLRDGADSDAAGPQLARFDAAVEELAAAGVSAPRHAGASAAILTGQGVAYELVRPGLALFGMTPDEALVRGVSMPAGIRPAMSVHARPVRLARLPAGTPVGYGGTFVTERPTLLATLPLGYADGLFRSLGNGRWSALVRGQRARIVGRISMDGITVDVTDVAGVRLDDRFTLLGSQGDAELTGNAMAAAAGTIPQEIAIRFPARLPYRFGPEEVVSAEAAEA